MNSLLLIAYRNLFRHKIRSFLCIFGIFVAILWMIMVQSFIGGMNRNFIRIIQTYESGHTRVTTGEFETKKRFQPVQYPVESSDENLEMLIARLKSIKGIREVFPRIQCFGSLSNKYEKHAIIAGIDLERELAYHPFNPLTKDAGLKEGRLPDPLRNECMIGYRLAEKMGVKTGDRITIKIISSQFSEKFITPEITGLFDFDYSFMDSQYIILPFEKLQKITRLSGKTQKLLIYYDRDSLSDQMTPEVRKALENYPDIRITDWKNSDAYTNIRVNAVVMRIIFVIFFLMASLFIVNTLVMIIFERTREIGVMSSMGMTAGENVITLMIEGLLMSLTGVVLGCLVGGAGTWILSFFPINFEKMSAGISWSSNTVFIAFSWSYLIEASFLAVITSLLCIFLASRRVTRLSITDCLASKFQ